MRRLVHGAHDERRRHEAVGRRDKLDLGAAALEQDIRRIFADRGDHIVALRQPVEQLHSRIESVRLQLGEFLPEAVAVELAQHVPLHELQPRSRNLAANLALPARIKDVLPAFRRIGTGDLVCIVGDAGRIDAGPEEVAVRRAQVVFLVRAGFRRLVFAFGMMWAWLVFPIPIYGTLWLLLIAYLTVFLPLGVRTIAGVMLQVDKSLDECAQMCGASWTFRMRTVGIPLLVPGLVAAWLLLFIASVRELGASILLMGPHSKVITPSIVESWFGTASELTATLALIQTLVVAAAVGVLVVVTRRLSTVSVN